MKRRARATSVVSQNWGDDDTRVETVISLRDSNIILASSPRERRTWRTDREELKKKKRERERERTHLFSFAETEEEDFWLSRLQVHACVFACEFSEDVVLRRKSNFYFKRETENDRKIFSKKKIENNNHAVVLFWQTTEERGNQLLQRERESTFASFFLPSFAHKHKHTHAHAHAQIYIHPTTTS